MDRTDHAVLFSCPGARREVEGTECDGQHEEGCGHRGAVSDQGSSSSSRRSKRRLKKPWHHPMNGNSKALHQPLRQLPDVTSSVTANHAHDYSTTSCAHLGLDCRSVLRLLELHEQSHNEVKATE